MKLLISVSLLVAISLTGNVYSEKNCDKLGIHYYDQRGCSPQYENSSSCPSYYTCNKSITKIGYCTYWNSIMKNDEEMIIGCETIKCNVEIKTKPGILENSAMNCFVVWPITPGCTGKYTSLNTINGCCGIGQNCETDSKICFMDGKFHNSDEIFLRKDKCEECICTKNETDGSYKVLCEPIKCPYYSWKPAKIVQNCAPVYEEGTTPCCPEDYICEEDDGKISGDTVKSNVEERTCRFGEKYFAKGSKFTVTSSRGEVINCKCEVPPNAMCTSKFEFDE